jgi:pyridoxamine 5'-phosphate oxidase
MNNPTSGLTNSDSNVQIDENLPFSQFAEWLAMAEKTEPNDPSAMSIATVDKDGMPNVRMVLMRRHDERGIVFFTNFESQKGEELLHAKKAAANFHWKTQRKQVRFRGLVEVVSEEEADEYFYSRPRGSRIGAHASQQSRPLESRFALEKAVAKYSAKFGVGEIPRPAHWSGFRIKPTSIEFWNDGKFRLHDRERFDREGTSGNWNVTRLYP